MTPLTPTAATDSNAPAFVDSFAIPIAHHAMTPLGAGSVMWCIRCGAVLLGASGASPSPHWVRPSATGRSEGSIEAPSCVTPVDMSAETPSADSRLMLHALTHGWRCASVLLDHETREAWCWYHEELLKPFGYSVRGCWRNGPTIDDTLRQKMLLDSQP